MAKILQVVSGAPASLGASTTVFANLCNGPRLAVSSGEANKQVTYRTAGVLSNLYTRVLTNDRAASTMRSRDNVTDGNQVITITGSTTGEFEDTTNSDTVVAGDEYAHSIVTGAGGTTFTRSIASCLFAATTNTVGIMTVDYGGASVAGSASDRFFNLVGTQGTSTTEANNKIEINCDGTLKNGLVYISTNGRDVNIVLNTRIAGVDGAITLTVVALTTGFFEDIVNTDAVVAGQDCNWVIQLDASGAGSASFRTVKVEFETTNGKSVFGLGSAATAEAMSASTTYFLPLSGDFLNDFTTETDVTHDANVAFTGSMLWCNLSTNTIAGNSELRFRKNAANGNQVVTITGLTTGEFMDAVNTDSVIATDEVNYTFIGGAAGTSMTIRSVSMVGAFDATTKRIRDVILHKGIVVFRR